MFRPIIHMGNIEVVKIENNFMKFSDKVTIRRDGLNRKEFDVIGSSTVWHYYPSGNRCDTNMECDIVNAISKYNINNYKI